MAQGSPLRARHSDVVTGRDETRVLQAQAQGKPSPWTAEAHLSKKNKTMNSNKPKTLNPRKQWKNQETQVSLQRLLHFALALLLSEGESSRRREAPLSVLLKKGLLSSTAQYSRLPDSTGLLRSTVQ